jgi:hypothetical protein
MLHITYPAGFSACCFAFFPKDLLLGLSSFWFVAGVFFPPFVASNWFILGGIRMVNVAVGLLCGLVRRYLGL